MKLKLEHSVGGHGFLSLKGCVRIWERKLVSIRVFGKHRNYGTRRQSLSDMVHEIENEHSFFTPFCKKMETKARFHNKKLSNRFISISK